jgi:hypothetical protein
MDNIKFTRVFDHATKRWIEVPEDVDDQEEYVIDVKKELARRHYKGDISMLKTKPLSSWTEEEKWLFGNKY